MRSEHLTVISDAGEKRARQVALQFTAIEELFGALAGARPRVTRPVRVFAMTDAAAMKELIPRVFRGKNKSHPAGVFVRGGDAHTIVMRLDVGDKYAYHVLNHEYVHLLTELSYRRLPVWLNEGLAEFYGSADIEEDGAYFGQVFPWHVDLLNQRSPCLSTASSRSSTPRPTTTSGTGRASSTPRPRPSRTSSSSGKKANGAPP